MSKNQLKFTPSLHLSVSCCAVMATLALNVWADNKSIKYHDLVPGANSGINYRRGASVRNSFWNELKNRPVLSFMDMALIPLNRHGAPGVAILDYDRDGDEDIYVTNGPGESNALYSNQLVENGKLTFVDMAISAGVAATDMDSNGVCFGDIDNDGDEDLYVLGAGEPNRLFENLGDRTFSDITHSSAANAGVHYGAGCSMGDVNGDGLLDIVIGNTSNTWDNRFAIFDPFTFNDHNQLFINRGQNVFEDASESSGIQNLAGFPSYAEGSAGISWAISMVDYDLDGDTDIITADDQGGGVLPAALGGVDRGLVHIMKNDGKGNFKDVSVTARTNISGDWMGLSFGDLNSDGHLDMFVTNVGDYVFTVFPRPKPYQFGETASRWFLGTKTGSFLDPGIGSLKSSVFGWGTVMADYDNDGDTDIVYMGGGDAGPHLEQTNPGVILKNDGTANFSYEIDALNTPINQSRRGIHGVATGDLNKDGFIDIVSVSGYDIPKQLNLIRYEKQWGSDVDASAYMFPSFNIIGPNQFVWNGLEPVDGSLSVDISDAGNDNHWVTIDVLGTVGLTGKGKANRDGIGATVSFTPDDGKTVMRPILGGASYASQDSLTSHFGLGQADEGMVEVLWPGGVRNRLYNVKASEHIKIPEIPCGFNMHWKSHDAYGQCVNRALREIVKAGVIDHRFSERLRKSAQEAYSDQRKRNELS